MSVRLKLTLSYAGFLMVAGAGLIAVVWVFLLRYVPDQALVLPGPGESGLRLPSTFIPGRSDLWRAFAPKAALMLGLLLVVGLVGGWILAGRMLAPLARITAATRAVGGGSLSNRIAMPGRQDEFRELADAIDGMFARIEAHVDEQQRFAANASHELRTPLAITQTLLEVARKDPDPDTDELLERLHAVNTRAIDLTEAMLLLSRAEQRSFVREQFDLSLVLEEAVEGLLPLAEKRRVDIEVASKVTQLEGSQALVTQLTSNLLHNAIVHNRDTGGTVWLSTRHDADAIVLMFENTGEPLDERVVATLTERFQRGTQRIAVDHAGAGLGLAIAASITHAHDGELSLVPRPGGGLVATVRLPATPQ